MQAHRWLIAAALLAFPTSTFAQGTGGTGGTSAGGGATSVVSGPGIKVGEDSVVHPYAGTEVGVISNVFYEEDGEENGSAILNLIAGIDWLPASSDATRGGNPVGKTVDVTAGLQLRYQEFLTSNDLIQTQRALGVDGHGRIEFVPGRTWNGYVADTLVRSYRSPNFETSDNILRIVNRAQAGLRWRPPGNTLSGELQYQNTIDYFEDSDISQFANRIQHRLMLRANWQWLPITKFYLQASQGFYSGLGDNQLNGATYKQSSLPLDLRIGGDTAITELTSFRAFFGWGWGFYANGASYSSPTFGGDFGWQYSPLGKLNLGFRRRFNDSINANYYADWALRMTANQQVDRFLFTGTAQYIRRRYEGLPTAIGGMSAVRDDNVFGVGAEVRFFLGQRFALNASYDLAVVDTSFRGAAGMDADDPSYVRHMALAGVHASF